MDLTTKRILVVVMSVFFLGALLIVAYHESGLSRPAGEPKVYIGESSKACIECHERKDVARGVIRQWKLSKHAQKGIGCLECHQAEAADFDVFTCPESMVAIGSHPTPKDCQSCHEDQVNEHKISKHGLAQNFYAIRGADRNLFEPPIATKNGCDMCHNIGNYWPDGSIGECDACHPKHTFDLNVARNPYTCGECHIGPDHPQIEQYLESKHGNVITSAMGTGGLDMAFKSDENTHTPLPAPVCTTCHMDAAPGIKSTHNVSSRLAWEMQAPYSFRTVWNDEAWEPKRQRMAAVCNQCHADSFIDTYLLTADLVQLQYNEFYKSIVYWAEEMERVGIITPLKDKDGNRITKAGLNGYDEEPEAIAYHSWHHEGRRFRMGAMMMSPDYTQWHGIWEMQHDLVNMINYAAEHGLEEAKKWRKVSTPDKFYPYALFDIPGVAWGITTLSYKKPWTSENIPDYWPKVKANVEAAYKHGLFSNEQWELWLKMYDNKEHYLGLKYDHPEYHEEMERMLKLDTKALKEQILDFQPPSGPVYPIGKVTK